MSDLSLEKEIFDMIVGQMGLEEVLPTIAKEKLSYDTPIFESMDPEGLALDSLSALDLVILIKEKYGIEVEDEDFKQLDTISNIAKFVRSRR